MRSSTNIGTKLMKQNVKTQDSGHLNKYAQIEINGRNCLNTIALTMLRLQISSLDIC